MLLKFLQSLQPGAAGLFFLLPILAYNLIGEMMRVPKLDPTVVRLFYWFLGFEVVLVMLYLVLKLAETRSRQRDSTPLGCFSTHPPGTADSRGRG